MKPVSATNFRVWLFTWMEYKSETFVTFEDAHDYARRSGEAWRIVRLSDDVGLAQSTMEIRKPKHAEGE